MSKLFFKQDVKTINCALKLIIAASQKIQKHLLAPFVHFILSPLCHFCYCIVLVF